MLDIGLGEMLLIAVLALLVFGPDRLPKVAADAARLLRQVRQISADARRNLVEAAGTLDEDGELAATVREIRNLDPRRAAPVLDERADTEPEQSAPPRTAPDSPRSDSEPALRSADPDWT